MISAIEGSKQIVEDLPAFEGLKFIERDEEVERRERKSKAANSLAARSVEVVFVAKEFESARKRG